MPFHGDVVGLDEHIENEVYHAKIASNDIIFMYTDGLRENKGPNNQMVRGKFRKDLELAGSYDNGVIQAILQRTEQVWQGEPPEDDMTLLAFRWAG